MIDARTITIDEVIALEAFQRVAREAGASVCSAFHADPVVEIDGEVVHALATFAGAAGTTCALLRVRNGVGRPMRPTLVTVAGGKVVS